MTLEMVPVDFTLVREEKCKHVLWPWAGVGYLFGAFHCVAWSFYFPSHAEMVLWRFSSMAILISLIVGGHIRVEISSGTGSIRNGRRIQSVYLYVHREMINLGNNFGRHFFLHGVCGIVAYIVARIILIILAFLQLRSLPPARLLYRTVDHLHPSHIVMVAFCFPRDECIFGRIELALSGLWCISLLNW